MSWRQVDCHINNLYNTTFWTLIQRGDMSPQEAEKRLSGTVSAEKNELLFKDFGMNYNNEPDIYKKGSILYRDYALVPPTITPITPPLPTALPVRNRTAPPDPALRAPASIVHAPILLEKKQDNESGLLAMLSRTQADKLRKRRAKADVVVYSGDLVKDGFWQQRPWILEGGVGRPVE